MKLRLATLTLFVFVASAYAQKIQGFAESENVITSTAATPQLNLLASGTLTGKVGWKFWGLTSRTWSEGYIGPTYAPTSWLTLSAGAGAETGGARFGWSASGKKRKLFYAVVQEWGYGCGWWHKNVATYDLTSRVSAGVWNEYGKGTGPTVNVRVIGELRPYVTLLASKTGTMAIVGATYSFSIGHK